MSENNNDQNSGKIAGKFNSYDELINSYQALERKTTEVTNELAEIKKNKTEKRTSASEMIKEIEDNTDWDSITPAEQARITTKLAKLAVIQLEEEKAEKKRRNDEERRKLADEIALEALNAEVDKLRAEGLSNEQLNEVIEHAKSSNYSSLIAAQRDMEIKAIRSKSVNDNNKGFVLNSKYTDKDVVDKKTHDNLWDLYKKSKLCL